MLIDTACKNMQDIRYIIHTADLHIGKSIAMGREEEFRSVFATFGDIVNKKSSPYNSIIVVAGDIFDRKDNLTANEISLFDYFIKCVEKYEIIIIPGNNDGIVNNPSRMDLLTPLVKHYPNIIYLRDTTVIVHRGITFIHISVYDKITSDGILELISQHKDPILLYHGAINGCTFNNYIESNSRITIEIQNKCKAILAGDIHEMQYVGNGKVAYSGSLLQHDINESHDKGFIVWDIINGKSGVLKVPNEYRQYKLDLNKMSIDDIRALDCAKNVHKVNVIVGNNSNIAEESTDEKLLAVREKFGRIDNVCKTSKMELACTGAQVELLRQLLTSEKATPDEIDSIVKIHSELTAVQKAQKWYIKSVKFDNMYKYGSGNYINFEPYNGDIIGVIANNQAGKSTILDVIMFGLYNILLRGSTKGKVNHYAKNTFIEIVFCVNNIDYTIQRTDYISCKSHKLTRGNEDLTEKSITATYDKIKTLIGSHTEFLSTSMYYDNTYDIIKMTPSARKCLFASLFGVYEKKALIDKIKSWISECNLKISTYGQTPRTIEQITADINNNLRECEITSSELMACEETYIQYEKILMGPKMRQICDINADAEREMKTAKEYKEIVDKLSTLVTINCMDAPYATGDKIKLQAMIGDYPPSDVLRKEIELLSTNTYTQTVPPRSQAVIQSEINNLQCEIPSTQILQTVMAHEDRKRYLKAQILDISAAISAANGQYLAAKKTYEGLSGTSKLQYNTACEQCKHNMGVINADLLHATNDLKLHEDKLNNTRRDTQGNIQKYEHEISIIETTVKQLLRKHELDHELDISIKYENSAKSRERIAQLRDTLSRAIESEAASKQLEAIKLYEQSQLNKQLNAAKHRLGAAKLRLVELSKEFNAAKEFNYSEYNVAAEEAPRLRRNMFDLGSKLAVLQHKQSELQLELQNAQKFYDETPELYNKIRIYELYKKCIDVKGLITLIVKENMVEVVNRVNHILSQITTFRIEHSADDNNISFDVIDTTTGNNDRKYMYDIDTASGFQKFIISLVMRLVLSYALNGSCQCMFIDEGFACMDKNNIDRLHDLFTMLKQEYKYIFIISHLPDIQNIIERRLYIQQHRDNPIQSYITNVAVSVPTIPQKNTPIKALEVNNNIDTQIITAGGNDTNDMIICECGMRLRRRSKYMHMKTKKHIDNLNAINKNSTL